MVASDSASMVSRSHAWPTDMTLWSNSPEACTYTIMSSQKKLPTSTVARKTRRTGFSVHHHKSSCSVGYCKQNQLEGAFLLYDELIKSGLLPDVVTYTSLMAGLCKSGKVAEGLKLFAEMKNKGVCPNHVSYSVLMDTYFKAQKEICSLLVLKEVVVRGIVFDLVSYTALMDGFFKAGMVGEAEDVFKTISNLPLVPNHITYSALIDGGSKAGDLSGAEFALDEMQRISVDPNVVSYTSIVIGYISTGMFVGAIDVVKKMEAKHISPNVVTYGSLINGYLREGTIDVAFDVYEEMTRRKNIDPYNYVLDFLVNGLKKNGRMEDAESLYRDMKQRGLSPDCVNIGVCGLCGSSATGTASIHRRGAGILPMAAAKDIVVLEGRTGKFDNSMKLFSDMKEGGLQPAVVTYSPLLSGCVKAKLCSPKALEIIQELQANVLQMAAVLYGTLLALCASYNPVQEAKPFFQPMQDDGLVPNIFHSSSLLTAYSVEGNCEEADKLLQDMNSVELVPHKVILPTLLKVYVRGRFFETSRELLVELEKLGHAPAEMPYCLLLGGLANAGHLDDARAVFNDIRNKEVQSDGYAYSIMISAYCSSHQVDEAKQLAWEFRAAAGGQLFFMPH